MHGTQRIILADRGAVYNTESPNTLQRCTTFDAALSLAQYQPTFTFATFGLAQQVLDGVHDLPIRSVGRGTGPLSLQHMFCDLLGPECDRSINRSMNVFFTLNAYVLPTVPQAHHYADRVGIHEWEPGIRTVVQNCPHFATDLQETTQVANFRDDHPFIENLWGLDAMTTVLSNLKTSTKATTTLLSAAMAAKTLWGAFEDWKTQHGRETKDPPITSAQYETLGENLVGFLRATADSITLQLKQEKERKEEGEEAKKGDSKEDAVDDTTWRRVVVTTFLAALGVAAVGTVLTGAQRGNNWQQATMGPERPI